MELTSSRPPQGAAAAPPTVTTAVHATRSPLGGQCSGCGARLAGDQRYCTECGRRTGEARPTLMREPGHQGPAALSASPADGSTGTRSVRTAPGGVLLAGIAVLLLAMGVGVLIGNSGNRDQNTTAAAPQVITAAPAAVVAATTPTADASAADAGSTDTAAADTKAAKKAAKAAAAAAAKTTTAVKPAAGKTVKVGDKGSGPGYDKKSGEFTGDFFGP